MKNLKSHFNTADQVFQRYIPNYTPAPQQVDGKTQESKGSGDLISRVSRTVQKSLAKKDAGHRGT